MTIVQSLGVTTLVALMSAHRAAAQQRDTPSVAFGQAAVEAIEAYLRRTEAPGCEPATATPPSCN
jgi:predicted house-cleaning NTP pyrophosphatase (Maf/HAM1 superfamily)